MEMIKVSVVIPVYNAEKYLCECLDSAAGQTLRDVEILCIDDGSTDNSAAVVAQYIKKDPRIRLIRQENSGSGAARNRGIRTARGGIHRVSGRGRFLPGGRDAGKALPCGGGAWGDDLRRLVQRRAAGRDGGHAL